MSFNFYQPLRELHDARLRVEEVNRRLYIDARVRQLVNIVSSAFYVARNMLTEA